MVKVWHNHIPALWAHGLRLFSMGQHELPSYMDGMKELLDFRRMKNNNNTNISLDCYVIHVVKSSFNRFRTMHAWEEVKSPCTVT
jgi:hypothetical protein